jgi:hypothetical protein
MGAAAAPIAIGASLGSAALSGYGKIQGAKGTKAADEMQAARLERAAQYATGAAAETDANLRQKLNLSLGNIDVVRAAAGLDPSSPTTAALRDRTSYLSDTDRNIRVGNILAQRDEDLASAGYLHKAGSYALKMGYLNAAASVLRGVAGTAAGGFGGGGGGDIPYAPDDI